MKEIVFRAFKTNFPEFSQQKKQLLDVEVEQLHFRLSDPGSLPGFRLWGTGA